MLSSFIIMLFVSSVYARCTLASKLLVITSSADIRHKILHIPYKSKCRSVLAAHSCIGKSVPPCKSELASLRLQPVDLWSRQITISITAPQGAVQQDLLTIDVGSDMTIGDLKAVIEGDSQIPSDTQILYHNGQELQDNSRSLGQANIKQDDMLGLLVRNHPSHPRSTNRPPGRTATAGAHGEGGRGAGSGADAEMIRLQALGNPGILSQIRAQNQELADAVHDSSRWSQIYDQMLRQQQNIEAQKQRELALLNADPFNVEAQGKIEEMIRQERVIENLQHAMDHTPEGMAVPSASLTIIIVHHPTDVRSG